MKQFITACILLLTAFTINAQGWQTKNLLHLNGFFDDYITDSAVDSDGNKYMVGRYDYYSPDFDPGPGVVTLSEFEPGSFIVKLDSSNNFIWVKGFETLIPSISLDNSGNIYFSGYSNANPYSSTDPFDCDPSSGTYILYGARAVVIKLDQDGEFIWGRKVYEEGGSYHPTFTASGNGEVYYYNQLRFDVDSLDVDPGVGEHYIYNDYPNASRFPYIVKLDTDGNFEWVKTFNGPGEFGRWSHNLETDNSGNVMLFAEYKVLIDFDPNGGVHELSTTEPFKPFLLKLSTQGDFMFVNEFDGRLNNNISNTNHLIVTDNFGDSYNVVSNGGYKYIYKTDPTGTTLTIEDPFTNTNTLFLFKGEFNNLYGLAREGYESTMNIVKWDQNGDVVSIVPIYENLLSHITNWTIKARVAGNELHIYGSTSETQNLYTTCDNNTLSNLGSWDGYYHVLESCGLTDTMFICSTQPVQETYLTEFICEGDTSSTGESVSGNYVYNLFTAQFGCDSTVYLDLTVNDVVIDTINNQVIITDTTYNYVEIYDTTFNNIVLNDTSYNYVEINDTTYNYVEIQDTTFNNIVINDTTYNNIVLNDTSYNPIVVDIFINDTTYNNIVLNDTSYNTIIVDILLNDTTYNNLILIDTTYEFVEIYDTTFNDILIIDTMYTYVEVYDTTYNDIGLLEIDCTTFTSQEEITQQGIEVYPNPFTEAFYSSTTGKLYNIQGQFVMDVVDGLNYLNQTGMFIFVTDNQKVVKILSL